MNKKGKRILFIIAALVVIGTISYGTIFLTKAYLDNKILPKTYLAGINVSYQTPDYAKKSIDEKTSEYLSKKINITVGGEKKEMELKKLGITFLNTKTANLAGKINVERDDFIKLLNEKEKNYPLFVSIDKEVLKEEVEKIFISNEQRATKANFKINKRKLDIIDGNAGKSIDIDGLEKSIKKAAANLSLAKIEGVILEGEHEINRATLEQEKEKVSKQLLHIFSMKDPIYSDNFKERLIDHPDWVDFDGSEIHINKEAFEKYIDSDLAKWLDKPTKDVKIYRDEKEKLTIEGEGHNGSQIEREKLRQYVEKAVKHMVVEIPVPTLEIVPNIEVSMGLQQLGIKERLSVGHTSFYGSPKNRVQNINVAAETFNGTLIAPEEVFSFNKKLGVVDESTGYKEELVIKPEGTIPEYGGGICQVSTTMYRAALFAGINIAERNQHSYAVSYYSQIMGHGLDATIYLGGPDLKIVNDTGKHIVVQAYTKNEYELYFILYGTSDGRSIEMEGPYLSNNQNPPQTIYKETTDLKPGVKKEVEHAHKGFDALWYRIIKGADGAIIKETIQTKYKAMPAKVMVGKQV